MRIALGWLFCAFALLACGGGGDDPAGPAPSVTPPPSISAQPADQTVTEGATASFTVAATSAAALGYQWQRNGADIAGATAASYRLTAQLADSGSEFRVRVSNSGGAVTSDPARLTVTSAPRAGTLSLLPRQAVDYSVRANITALAVDAAGNIYTSGNRIYRPTPTGAVETGFFSTVDPTIPITMPGSGPQIDIGLALDAAGNVYVSSRNGKDLRKRTPDDRVTILARGFTAPAGIAVDAAGNVIVADAGAHSIKKVSPTGAVTLIAGSDSEAGAGNVDATGAAARFNQPFDVAVDAAGNIFVADTGNDSIRRISPQGEVTTFVAALAGLRQPRSLALDPAGNLLVADTGNYVVRKVTPDGAVSILAGAVGESGEVDGQGAAARFALPYAIAVDRSGNAFVGGPSSYQQALRKIDPAGNVTTVVSVPTAEPPPTYGSYLAADGAGNVFVARYQNPGTIGAFPWALLKIAPDGSSALYANNSMLPQPAGVTMDGAGNIYVVSSAASYMCEAAIAPSSSPTVVRTAPNGAQTFIKIGLTPSGQLQYAAGCIGGIAADSSGTMYLAEDRVGGSIVKATPAGVVSTFAANTRAHDLALDSAGNLYASVCLDPDGPTGPAAAATQIVRYSPQGQPTVLAGAPGRTGAADGPGAQASFGPGIDGACPKTGIALDAANNVYVADPGNHTVRKVTPAGIVSTVVGRPGVPGIVPGPLPAGLLAPTDLSFDAAGNLYVGSAHALVKVRFDP